MSPRTRSARVADAFWITAPRRVLRVSSIVGAALADGSYLRAWPRIAATAPLAAALLALFLGAIHRQELYTYSLALMAVLGIIAALSAGLGVWSLVAFAIGDLLLSRRDGSHLVLSVDFDGLRTVAALGLSYLILAGLLVMMPVVANVVRLAALEALTRRRVRARLADWGAGGVLVLIQGLLTFLWTQSTPFLVRPVWSYFGMSPQVPAIEPLQQRGWILALVVVLAAGGRLWLEGRASGRLDPYEMPGLAGGLRPPLPWPIAVAGRTVFVTFLLSGLIGTWWGTLITAAVLAAVFTLHVRVLPRVSWYMRAVGHVPVIVRVAVVAGVAYATGEMIVQSAVNRGGSSFLSLIVATIVSLLVLAILLPERPRHADMYQMEAA